MKKCIALMLVVGAMGVAACGDADPVEEATAVEPTTTVEDTTEPVEVDSAPTQDEVDQKIADQFAASAPGPLAKVCSGYAVIGEAPTERMFVKALGPMAIRQGGTLDGVFDALMAKC